MPDNSDSYDEAKTVLEIAKAMFANHSREITGYTWEWGKADEQVRTIWIVKATRSLPE